MLSPMREAQGFVLWLTGRSGSGKSSIAEIIVAELQERGLKVIVFDEANTLTPMLSDPATGYICAYRSPSEAERQQLKAKHERFVVVYVDAPERELRRRDIHGWYNAAAGSEGAAQLALDARFEPPAQPDIHLRTDMQSPLESAGRVLGALEDSGLIPLVEI